LLAEFQQLVDCLDQVNQNYRPVKTKVMASDLIPCHVLIHNAQLEQTNTFPYLGSLITEDGQCMKEF